VDLEAAEVELERQRQDFARQQAAHPLDNDDARTGAPNGLYFPSATYKMASTACRLEDFSNTLDPKTNEWLHEVKRLLHITLTQQAESSASRHHTALSRPSQTMATANGGRSNAHTPQAAGSSGDTTGNSFDWPRTRGTKPR
jgi:hypothetical protein